jgi:uncharacterized iron-regulated membrane protein
MVARPHLTATIWRWHFYAGLFVIPFVLILSVTGGLYLFKADFDRWQEAPYRGLPAGTAGAEAQVSAALGAVPPGSKWYSYRLPENPGDAAMVHLARPDGAMRDVYVSPRAEVLGVVDPASRFSAVLREIHGTLLLGTQGKIMVELAASWAIVLILTGLYLWWPKGRGLAGVLWPRRGKQGWRDLHAVTGFWVSGLALVLLLSGLPWTNVWSTAFRVARAELGLVDSRPQDWKGGIKLHAEHDHEAMMAMTMPEVHSVGLDAIVASARRETVPFPAIIVPPGAPAAFGPPNGPHWKLTTEVQDRTQVRSVFYDAASGEIAGRDSFADRHPIDKLVNIGIAWHEGALLGRFNQAVGVMTALMLITIAVSGTVLWWRKRPAGGIGPSLRPPGRMPRGFLALLLLGGLLLPMLGMSLLLFAACEWAIRPARRRMA